MTLIYFYLNLNANVLFTATTKYKMKNMYINYWKFKNVL